MTLTRRERIRQMLVGLLVACLLALLIGAVNARAASATPYEEDIVLPYPSMCNLLEPYSWWWFFWACHELPPPPPDNG